MPKFVLILLAVFFLIAGPLKAQQTWELGVMAGTSGYIGDFNPNQPFKFTDAAFGGFVKRNLNGYFSVKLNYTHGTIRGADSLSNNEQMRSRNLSFFGTLDELSLIGELNFMHYIPKVGKNVWTPFIFAGIGGVKFNPQATYNGVDYDLRPLTTEGQAKPYKQQALAIPYGAGIKYNFAGQWNLIVDLGYRTPNTGYLDDVNGAYANKNSFTNPIAMALSDRTGEHTGVVNDNTGVQRGNYRNNDSYMFLGFTLSFTFLTNKCYSFSN